VILSGKEIARRREFGDIKIEPWDDSRLNPNSYNVTLDKTIGFLVDERFDHRLLTWEGSNLAGRHHEYTSLLSDTQAREGRVPRVTIDMATPTKAHFFDIPPEGYRLEPGRLYLARTVEHTETKGLVPMIEGRSSIGRLGLFIHVTAGFGDVGFKGFWTLEIVATERIRIYPGIEIGQLFYHTVEGDKSVTYDGGKYQENTGIQVSGIWKEFK